MVESRLIRSELPSKQRKYIQDALNKLYSELVKNSDDKKRSKLLRWADFAKAFRDSLDGSCGAFWHVLVGQQLGFACKKRNQTVGIWKIDDCMVVIWKSPGFEPPEQVAATAAVVAATVGAAEGSAAAQGHGDAKLQVLQPSEMDDASELKSMVASIREELRTAPIDNQELAQVLRQRLTTDFGTIWHVMTGTEFVVEAAESRRNFLLATIGKTRIVAFQHEQIMGSTLLERVDFWKLLSTLPYLCMLLVCFGYMTLSSVCREDKDTAAMGTTARRMRDNMCYQDWENHIGMLGVFGMGLFFIVKKVTMVKSRVKAD